MHPVETVRRLQLIADIADTVPREEIFMLRFGRRHHQQEACRTVACLLGHASFRPEFQKLGLTSEWIQTGPRLEELEMSYNGHKMNSYHVGEMFGISQTEAAGIFWADTLDEAKDRLDTVMSRYAQLATE